MKKIFVCLIAAIAMTAWKQPCGNITIDALVAQWNNAWNSHDEKAIANLMDEHVVFLAGKNTRMTGRQEILEKFIKRNCKYIVNLKTQKITEKMFANSAFHYGQYHHDVLDDNGKIIGSSEGNYSFIWEKNKQGRWKLTAFELEEYNTKE